MYIIYTQNKIFWKTLGNKQHCISLTCMGEKNPDISQNHLLCSTRERKSLWNDSITEILFLVEISLLNVNVKQSWELILNFTPLSCIIKFAKIFKDANLMACVKIYELQTFYVPHNPCGSTKTELF